MNTKIKKLLLGSSLLTAVFVLSGCSNPFSKNVSQNTSSSQTQPAQVQTTNVETKAANFPSVNDLLKDANNPVECGQTCKDESCSEVKSCLLEHATNCSSAKGKVLYPVPNNNDKKVSMEHIIIGKEGDQCVTVGAGVGVDPSLPSLHTFKCKVSTDIVKQLFASDVNLQQFVIKNCSGTYVDFLKAKQTAAPVAN